MPGSIPSRRQRSVSSTLSFDSFGNVPAVPGSVNAAQSYNALPLREAESIRPSISTSTTIPRSCDRYQDDQTSQSVDAQRTKSSPATLTRSAYQRWFSTPLDVLISLVPMLFLIVASLCLSIDTKPVSSYGEDLRALTLLSPTIFPIVYAAILGKMLRRVGHFKAERSATIGTVERFIGCQSLFATLERQFGLRRVDFLSVSILFAWLLSPLGGQSSLRLLSTHPQLRAHNSTIQYFPISGFENQTILNLDMAEGDWPQFAPLYMTALQTSRRTLAEPMDLYGNVKIPDITLLKDFQSISDANVSQYNGNITPEFRRYHSPNITERGSGWYKIPKNSPVRYTSLLGVPVAGIPSKGNSTFNLTTAYWDFKCDPFTYKKGRNVTDIEGLEVGPFGPSFAMDLDKADGSWISYYKTMYYEMTMGSKIASNEMITTRCAATWSFAESHVKCQASACAVEQMRELFIPVNATISHTLALLCRHMPGADMGFRQSMTTSSELVEQWVQDPNLETFIRHNKRFGDREIWVNHTEIPIDLFNHRFKMALNTFWDSTLGLQYRMGNLTAGAISDQEDRANNLTWAESDLQGSYFDGDQYACNKTFAIITIVISWFLFMAANISVILGVVTMAPDILGYVSTCARDNPYFEKYVASHFDGLEAARALRDVRIIIGDVRREDDVGHIAFSSMDILPERVNRTRFYD